MLQNPAGTKAATPSGRYVAETYRDRLGKATVGTSRIRFQKAVDLDERVLAEVLRGTAKADFGRWGP